MKQLISDSFMPATCSGGKIEVAVWGDSVDGRLNTMQVAVDAGFVMIGGGAQVTNFSNTNVGVNALLTAAYPINDGTFTKYAAASKDHQQIYSHRLWVYVIGLKIYSCDTDKCEVTLTPAQIIASLNITEVTSSPAAHFPSAIAIPPTGYTPLSGGAFIHWTDQGNLLVVDGIQQGGGLGSAGKDQQVSSPATITAYCLSIRNPIFCGAFPYPLNVSTKSNQVIINQHAQSVSYTTDAGHLLSGVSGASEFAVGGNGRLLFAMYPQNSTSATVSSKDQGATDISGNLVITIFQISPGF